MRPNPALDKAQNLIAAGHSQQALDLLERNSVDPDCAVRLRELYLGEQQREKALFVTRQLAFGTNAEAHVSRSISALMEGDMDSAVRECEQAIQMDGQLSTAHHHLGRALQNAGNTLQAVSALRKAVEIKDAYPEAWSSLGLVLRASGAMEEAVSAYRKAVELAPGFVVPELNLGISLLVAERVDEALFCLESVLERAPENIEALTNAGLARHLMGEFSAARSLFERAIELDGSNAMAWCYLGILLNEMNAPEAALEALDKAVSLDPMDVDAWVEMASVHEQSGKLDEARQALNRASEIDPVNPGMQLELARLKRRQGKLDVALRQLQALGSQPLPLRLAQQHRQEAGIALDRAGLFEQALPAFEESQRLLASSLRRKDIDPAAFEARCQSLESWLERGAPGSKIGNERDSDTESGADLGQDLCFLIGFPGSGTSMLAAMLQAHPDIVCLSELATLEAVVTELRQLPGQYPDLLETLDEQQLESYRSLYRKQLGRFLNGHSARMIVDHLPLRLLNVALIQRLFPKASLLFVQRHPADVVLHNFTALHAENEAFIHFDSLQESADMYARVMGLWPALQEQLSLRIHTVSHESLLSEPNKTLAEVFEYLELVPIESDAKLDPASVKASPVQTSTLQALLDPAYPRASGHWKNYRFALEPLMPKLKPFIESFEASCDE